MENKEKKLDDMIFKFVYITAIRDAVIQKAYNGEKKWTEKEEIIDNLKDIIEPLVDNVIHNNFKTQKEYDDDFLDITIKICEYMNCQKECNKFKFGNAQKLVNMMLKYFYINNYKDTSKKEGFRFCHCPLDGKMLEIVWSKCREIDEKNTYGKREWFLKSWGNEEFDVDDNGNRVYPERYIAFQQAVNFFAKKSKMSPIEFDYCEW